MCGWDPGRRIWNSDSQRAPAGDDDLRGWAQRAIWWLRHGWLGAVGFAAAALHLAARERWMGWSDEAAGLSEPRGGPDPGRLREPGQPCSGARAAALAGGLPGALGYRPWRSSVRRGGSARDEPEGREFRGAGPDRGARAAGPAQAPRGGAQDGDGVRVEPEVARAAGSGVGGSCAATGAGRGPGRRSLGAERVRRGKIGRQEADGPAGAQCAAAGAASGGVDRARTGEGQERVGGRVLPADREAGGQQGECEEPAGPASGADDPAHAGAAHGAVHPAGATCASRGGPDALDWR